MPTDEAPDIYEAAHRGDLGAIRQYLAADNSLINSNSPQGYHVGETALHVAIAAQKADAARLLIAAGADVDARNYDGETPLHIATVMDFPEGVQLLLEANANPNLRSHLEQGTPLYFCCFYWLQSYECAKLLLAAGADANAMGESGYAPLDYVDADSPLYALLRAHGGKTRAELEARQVP